MEKKTALSATRDGKLDIHRQRKLELSDLAQNSVHNQPQTLTCTGMLETLQNIGKDVLKRTPIAQEIIPRTNKCDPLKLNSIYTTGRQKAA